MHVPRQSGTQKEQTLVIRYQTKTAISQCSSALDNRRQVQLLPRPRVHACGGKHKRQNRPERQGRAGDGVWVFPASAPWRPGVCTLCE